jgi:hypothetical protein
MKKTRLTAKRRAHLLARKRKYRKTHQAQIRAYRAAHRDQAAAREKAYRAAHRDEINARKRAYRATHPRPSRATRPKRTVADRFWSYVQPGPGCWVWSGLRTYNGYGLIKIGRKPTRAHRVAYELLVGTINPGLLCLHKCDNPPCVNPGHLFLGTARDNMVDAITKGRWTARQPTPRQLQTA